MKTSKIVAITGAILSLALLTALTYVGCGGGGSSSGSSSVAKLTLTGRIGTGYQKTVYAPPQRFFDKFFPPFMNTALAYGTGAEVDKIIALQCLNGFLSEQSMQNAKEAIINLSDGTFNISLEKDRNWILILVNSQASGTARFVGYVALNDGSGENLLQIPVP